MRQVPSLSRRQLLSGALAATLGLAGWNKLKDSDSGSLDRSPGRTATNATRTLVLTETTTHAVTTSSSNPGDRATSTETTSPSSATATTASSAVTGSGGDCRSTTTSTTTTPSATSTTTTTSKSGEIVVESDEHHIEGVAATESYNAVEWHPGGVLVIEDGTGLELTESTS